MDSDILVIKVINRKIVIVTESETIEGPIGNQLNYILKHFGFEEVFQNHFANMDKIIDYDENNLYFENKKITFCPVSRRNKYKIKRYFDKFDKNQQD